MNVIEARELSKSYVGGDGGRVDVLNGVSLDVRRGEMIAVVGAGRRKVPRSSRFIQIA